MSKDRSIFIRVNKDEYRQLERLAATTVRNKSDMVRFLIREKYAQIFGEGQPNDSESSQDQKISASLG